MKKHTSKIYSISDDEFIKLIKNSFTYSDCLRKLGLKCKGGSSTDILKNRIQELNCSTSHFVKGLGGKSNPKIELKDILVENSTYNNIARLKTRLIKNNLIEYKCCICGISEWNNKYISLHLDHINGNHNDHRLENLRFLCPNCHSQTDTYSGKNKNKGV